MANYTATAHPFEDSKPTYYDEGSHDMFISALFAVVRNENSLDVHQWVSGEENVVHMYSGILFSH